MKLKKKEGISPAGFIEKPVKAHITASPNTAGDCVDCETKKSNSGKPFNRFKLWVRISGVVKAIPFLMEGQLSELMETYGEETQSWINNCVEISAENAGEYVNFVLKPIPEFTEEKVL